MIYTCTANPSLDYYMTFPDALKEHIINRTSAEDFNAGGKGVNVSIALNNLRIPNVAFGFLGGFTKDYYLSFLRKYTYIEPLFTTIKANTRINLKINAGASWDLNAQGPHIADEEYDRFKQRLMRIYPGDVFVLSGNVQKELCQAFINIIRTLAANGVKTVLDTNLEIVRGCLDVHPYLIRLSDESVMEWAQATDIRSALEQLKAQDVDNLIVSDDAFSTYLLSQGQLYYHACASEGLQGTTGVHDSIVAGYLYANQKGADPLDAFAYANAAALATLKGDKPSDRTLTDQFFNEIKIERLD